MSELVLYPPWLCLGAVALGLLLVFVDLVLSARRTNKHLRTFSYTATKAGLVEVKLNGFSVDEIKAVLDHLAKATP